MINEVSGTTATSQVTATPAKAAEEAHEYFLAKLACEADPADIARAIAAGAPDFVLVDCRPEGNYNKTHLPGAVNLPWSTDQRRRSRRPARRPARHLLLGSVVQCRHQGRRSADRARPTGKGDDRRHRVLDPGGPSDRGAPPDRAG